MAEPVRSKRTVIALQAYDPGVTAYPGTTPSFTSADILPIYDAFNPLQAEMETNPMNRARFTLDPEQFWIGLTTYRLQGNFYVYGSGNASTGYYVESTGDMPDTITIADALANLPQWSRLLLAAGFSPTYNDTDGTTGAYVLFNPVSQGHYYAWIDAYLDKHLHSMSGARGNLTFSGRASNPVQVALDFLGLYNKGSIAAWGGGAGSDPGLPPRLCGVDTFYLYPEGGSVITPKLKAFSLDLGVTPTRRMNANAANCLEGIEILQEFNPRLTCTFEVEDFDSKFGTLNGSDIDEIIEAGRQGQRWAFELNIGPYGSSNKGKRWQFRNYNAAAGTAPSLTNASTAIAATSNFRAQMTRAPQYTDDDGVRCYDVEFLLGGTNDNFLQIAAC